MDRVVLGRFGMNWREVPPRCRSLRCRSRVASRGDDYFAVSQSPYGLSRSRRAMVAEGDHSV
jgi:hypothetical protein